MIIAVHIPKTAGTSFRQRMARSFGSRMLHDYGDSVGLNTPAAETWRAIRMAKLRARRDELLRNYDLIYGHFVADKYVGLFPTTHFVGFFRDPYQQILSLYYFIMRPPVNGYVHPLVQRFRELRPTLMDFIEAAPNIQSTYLGRISIDDFTIVGLTEQYERSVVVFETVFDCKLPVDLEHINVNPHQGGRPYAIEQAVRDAIDRHSPADVDLYVRARERFSSLAIRFGC